MMTSDFTGLGRRRRHAAMMLGASLALNATPAHSITRSQINLNRPTQPKQQRQLGGAFNEALTAFDPNNPDYQHKDSGLTLGAGTTGGLSTADVTSSPQDYGAPQDWIQCPPEHEGHRASYDCTAYIMCSGGEMKGKYESCMGLMFDNSKGVCDWGEDVKCNSEGGEVELSGEGTTYSGEMDTATEFSPMGGSWQSEEADSGKPDAAAAWNGGSDWGGSWVEGVWVPAEEEASKPASKPAEPPSETAWIDQAWDPSQIKPYPTPPLSVLDEFLATDPKNNNETKVPKPFKSGEGWSVATRPKTLIGYYASWRWYHNSERSKPSNMKFQKVDRVNYAFFQTNPEGDIWGTDAFADPVILFGPNDWMVTIDPTMDYAPQFNDDNGFDDSTGEGFNYVGAKYVDLGEGVFCHRASPTGKRDCKGHLSSQGLIGQAHAQGAQVYVSIGGWSLSDAFPKLAASAPGRRNFAKNCVGLVREYGLDGVDIDWEFPGYEPHLGTTSDRDNFVLLLKDVRAAMDAYQKIAYPNGEKTIGLTAALPCIPPLIDSQSVSQISSIVTEMNLRTHDFHGTWNDMVGINAPLHDQDPKKFESPEYSVDGCVKRWISEGADPDKINIGLPFYGRSYGGSTKLYSSHSGADDIHWWEDKGKPQYHAILEKLPEMISLRDDVTSTQFGYFDGDKGGLVSFDDSQAICDKIEYGRSNDLHGYAIWEMSGDLTEDFVSPLLDVINIKLEQGDGFDCKLFRAESRDANGTVLSQADAEDNPWYANWERGECVNDGQQSTWEKEENLFRFKTECCSYKFEYKFDECMGPATYAPTELPSYSPTPLPTSKPTQIYGAAQVFTSSEPVPQGEPAAESEPFAEVEPAAGSDGLGAFVDSVGPTASITRLAEETSEGEPKSEGPVTWCMGGCPNAADLCVGNQNNPQAIDDETCKSCLEGQTFWPCDVDGLCFCWDPATARIPPAPASGKAQLSEERPCDYFTEAMFNELGPEAQFPYTYEGLCLAIDHYNEGHAEKIFMMGTDEEKKKEFAAFLGHTLHESDEWKAGREYLICADNKEVGGETFCKPCTADEFNWETFKCDGVGMAGGGVTYNGYCDYVIQPPLACPCDGALEGDADGYIPASAVFFGRGAIQVSWNYNYRAASEALTSDANTFCEDPDLVATTPEYAWGAAVFFWMENLKEETTCHIEALRNHDFGGTLNNVNGGLECPAYHGGWHGEAVKMRLNRYCRATATLGLDSIMVMEGCKGLNTSFAECLGDGTCPDCEPFADGVEPLPPSEHEDNSTSTVLEESSDHEDNSTITTTADEDDGNSTFAVDTDEEGTTPATDAASTTTVPPGTTGGTNAGDQTTDTATTVSSDTTEAATTTATVGFESAEENTADDAEPQAMEEDGCADGLNPVDGLPGCCLPEVAYLGDGACDPDAPYNTLECNWDNGDCCQETCNLDSNYGCGNEASQGYGPFGYFCLNPDLEEYVDPDKCTVSDRTRLGDGRCDADVEMYNTADCNWDGGDCCEETCDPVYAYFECGDPTYPYDCKDDAYPNAGRDPTTASPKTTTDSTVAEKTTTAASPTSPHVPSLKVTVTTSQDATIMKNDPDTPHGSDKTLQIRGTSNGPDAQDVIMRFIVPASQSNPIKAVVRVYALSDSASGGIFHIAPESGLWSDGTVTWNTAPEYTDRLGNLGQVKKDNWYEVDVTSAITALERKRKPITIRVRSRNLGTTDFSSREGSNPPELIISYPMEPDVIPDKEVGESSLAFAEAQTEVSPPKQDYTTSNIVNVASNEVYISVDEYSNSGDGSYYYPVWGSNGGNTCATGNPPSWATGPYLKRTKKQCCDAYFMLQKSECLAR